MYVRKKYTVIVNCNLTMIASCNEVVDFNCVTTGVTLTLSEQLLCNYHMALMCAIMPCVQLDKGP